jgi:hypothetical protein
MRRTRLALVSLLALAACGDDADGPTACEVGPDIVSEAVARVTRNQPACTRDDECVGLNMDLRCDGYFVSGCGDIVHRDVVARWDAAAVCREIDRASVPSNISCGVEAACAATGNIVCRSGRCTGDAW